MKNIFLILLLISTGLFAQRPNGKGQGPHHEKIKALKIAHITERLDLTSEEAEKFWPVYNQFDKKLRMLKQPGQGNLYSKLRNEGIDALTDGEALVVIDRMLIKEAGELEYRKQLVIDLKKIIPPQKIIKLQRAEESFKRMLLERLKEHRGKRE